MRIQAPVPLSSANRPASPRRSSSDFSGLVESEGASAPARACAPVSPTAIGALLALQGEEEPAQRRQRELRRCGQLIDELDDIRRGLLLGTLSAARLTQLAQRLKRQDRSGLDDGLCSLIDDIELRVAVELAKLGIVTN